MTEPFSTFAGTRFRSGKWYARYQSSIMVRCERCERERVVLLSEWKRNRTRLCRPCYRARGAQ